MVVLLGFGLLDLASLFSLSVDPFEGDLLVLEIGLDFAAVGAVECSKDSMAHYQKLYIFKI